MRTRVKHLVVEARSWILFLAVVSVGAPAVLALSGCDALFGLDRVPPQCMTGSEPNAYQCVCECDVPLDTPQHSLTASADDAEETISNASVLLTGLTLELGSAGGPQRVGLHFPAIGIPKGSTILSADLRFWVSVATTDASTVRVWGQKSGDSAAFTTATGDVSNRPLTSSVVSWTVPPWPTAGVSESAQISPELATIIQEIVDLDDWRPGNALTFVIEGSGHRAAVSFDANPSQSPVLRIVYETNTKILNDLFVCMPDDLNPNKEHPTPTAEQLAQDCEGRVKQTVDAMSGTCGYPSPCTCTAVPTSTKLVCGCNDGCAGETLASDCSNFHPPTAVTATHADGTLPVCTTHSPVAAAMYGQLSRCEVSGSVTLDVDGNAPDEQPSASGVVDLVGTPCPGASCAVGMRQALDVSDVTFSNFWSSRTFTDLASVGESVAGMEAVLDAGGVGAFAPDATLSTGRGRRGDDVKAIVTPNIDPIHVEVDWTPGAATCRVYGSLAGSTDPEAARCEITNGPCATDGDCPGDSACPDGVCRCLPIESAPMNFAIDVSGSIVNQPPTANAGADQVAECNVAGGARVVLDGSQSFDPDGNIADARWFRGTRTGPLVGAGPRAVVEQALATQASYVHRVVDLRAQADEDTTSVSVVDTTPPAVACNTPEPNTIPPPSAPISFRATATDVCDAEVTPTLLDARCFSINPAGKVVDRMSDKEGCRVVLTGDSITIADSGGVGDHVTWKARATDDSGNTTTQDCEIVIVKPR